jgi:hypothetical protein
MLTKQDHDYLESLISPLRKDLQDVEGGLRELRTSWFGNGTPGVKVRLDRLEQKEKIRVWVERTVAVCLLGLMVTSIYNLLTSP